YKDISQGISTEGQVKPGYTGVKPDSDFISGQLNSDYFTKPGSEQLPSSVLFNKSVMTEGPSGKDTFNQPASSVLFDKPVMTEGPSGKDTFTRRGLSALSDKAGIIGVLSATSDKTDKLKGFGLKDISGQTLTSMYDKPVASASSLSTKMTGTPVLSATLTVSDKSVSSMATGISEPVLKPSIVPAVDKSITPNVIAPVADTGKITVPTNTPTIVSKSESSYKVESPSSNKLDDDRSSKEIAFKSITSSKTGSTGNTAPIEAIKDVLDEGTDSHLKSRKVYTPIQQKPQQIELKDTKSSAQQKEVYQDTENQKEIISYSKKQETMEEKSSITLKDIYVQKPVKEQQIEKRQPLEQQKQSEEIKEQKQSEQQVSEKQPQIKQQQTVEQQPKEQQQQAERQQGGQQGGQQQGDQKQGEGGQQQGGQQQGGQQQGGQQQGGQQQGGQQQGGQQQGG
ncbi:MAG TPA: hypothetical protein PL110_08920, partial [Candidatus Eremiobacteraeota bacterium]|nr:hypothetical protein [Candidatus Eremiobacteraeota bacterium]